MRRTLKITAMLVSVALTMILVMIACSENEAMAQEPRPEMPDSNDSTEEGTPDNGKVLVAYFSRANYVPDGTDAVSGATNKACNTQTVAMEIARLTGGDLFEIVPERDYPVSHSECSQIALQEYDDDARPDLLTHVEDMDGYDIIYIGFPIWRYCEPMAIRTFLEEYDFSGKTIRPFCTSMAVDIEDAQANISRLCPTAHVGNGLRIPYTIPDNVGETLSEWINDNL